MRLQENGAQYGIGNTSATVPTQTYTVSYNANGGSGAPGSQTKTYGKTLTLSSTKPTRSGYTFVSWNTNSSGTGTSYSSGGSYTANSNATLYAIWQAPTLSLASTSGTVVDGATLSIAINGSGYGTLSVTSSNTSVATASISGTTLRVTGTQSSGTGTATITVRGSNGVSATYAVTAHKHGENCYQKTYSTVTQYCQGCKYQDRKWKRVRRKPNTVL